MLKKYLDKGNTRPLSYITGSVQHPNGPVNNFTNDLDDIFFSKTPTNHTCILVGDTNIDLIKYGHNAAFDYFTSICSSNSVP